jgi:hypothetical protein
LHGAQGSQLQPPGQGQRNQDQDEHRDRDQHGRCGVVSGHHHAGCRVDDDPDRQTKDVPHEWVVAEEVQPRRLNGGRELNHQEQQCEHDADQGQQARGDPGKQGRGLDAGDRRTDIQGRHQQPQCDPARDVQQLNQTSRQRPSAAERLDQCPLHRLVICRHRLIIAMPADGGERRTWRAARPIWPTPVVIGA